MNAALITLKVLIAVVLLACTPMAFKRRWRLFFAVPLAMVQGFVPGSAVAGTPIPLAFWGGLMLWPELIREIRHVMTWRPTAYIVGIVALYIVSLLWSPNPKIGLQPIGYFLEFLVIFAAVVTEGRRDENSILRLLMVTIAFGMLQALMVVIFRLMPGLKLEFYLSSLAKWFISPNSLKNMFIEGRNNVLSPGKSGGMLGVNANISAAYLGLLAFIAIGLAFQWRRRALGVIGVLLLAAVPFVGSKAGLLLASALPILALYVISWQYRRWRSVLRLAMIGIVLLGTLAWLGPKAFEASEGSGYRALGALLVRTDVTLSVREKIWGFAPQAFSQHPFRGQGFGGWQKSILSYARKVGLPQGHLPPHNTIIYLWSQGGLLAALLGLAFIYRVLLLGWRHMRQPNPQTFGLSLAMTFGFLWTFAQGMGENYGLLGDIHMSPLLACLLALAYLHRHSHVPALDYSPQPSQIEYGAVAVAPLRSATESDPLAEPGNT